jgi:hypothetical protein
VSPPARVECLRVRWQTVRARRSESRQEWMTGWSVGTPLFGSKSTRLIVAGREHFRNQRDDRRAVASRSREPCRRRGTVLSTRRRPRTSRDLAAKHRAELRLRDPRPPPFLGRCVEPDPANVELLQAVVRFSPPRARGFHSRREKGRAAKRFTDCPRSPRRRRSPRTAMFPEPRVFSFTTPIVDVRASGDYRKARRARGITQHGRP